MLTFYQCGPHVEIFTFLWDCLVGAGLVYFGRRVERWRIRRAAELEILEKHYRDASHVTFTMDEKGDFDETGRGR